MRGTTAVAGGALAHFTCSLVVVLAALGTSMRRFETGSPGTYVDRALGALELVLLHPLVIPVVDRLPAVPGVWGYVVFIANSILWSVGGWLVLRALGRRHR